tara:strand:+ start:864 stop:1319 length:456 start_codon:yes stop_codon:yes gene_type:complete
LISLNEILTFLGLFLASCLLWLPVYKHVVSKYVTDATIARIENGQIDLNYLLDEGGVFDNLANRTVTLFKQHMLSEMGTLSRVGNNIDPATADPMSLGLDTAGELLKAVGMRKPPAMLQVKLAQALGNMAAQQQPTDHNATFDPAEEFYKR